MNYTKEEIKKNNNLNINLFKFYRMFSRDLLFYYTISFLFFTQIKGFPAHEVLLHEASYTFFKVFFQMIATATIDKFSKKFSLIISNIFLIIFYVLVICCTKPIHCIIASIFSALGFAFKEVTEATFIFDFVEDTPAHKRKIFAKIDGKAASYYFLLSSIASFSAGFLFTKNPYLPMVLGLVCIIFSIILAFFFKKPHPEEEIHYEYHKHYKSYFKELHSSFSFILRSSRLKCLICFNALFYSLFCILLNYRSSLLVNINFSASYIGILFALFGVISSFGARRAHSLHERMKNTTLTYLSMIYCLATVLAGFVVYFKLPAFIMYLVVLSMFCIQFFLEGPYETLITQYLCNFTTARMRTKIYTVNSILTEAFCTIFLLFSSALLEYITTETAIIIIGAIYTILFTLLLTYMKKKVGLKPEEYDETEVYVK